MTENTLVIRQISTGKIVHRQIPHTEQTLANAASATRIDESDLEVHDLETQEAIDEYERGPWDDRRRHEKSRGGYGSFGEQLDMLYWDKINGTTLWEEHIAKIKKNHPKP